MIILQKFQKFQKRQEIPDHPYRILIFEGSGSGKTNGLLNLIDHEPAIDFFFFFDTQKLPINKRKSTGLKYSNYSKAFTKHLNYMDNIYKNIEECNPNKKRKILIIFGYIIPGMLNNKKLNPIVTELFIGGRKQNIYLVFYHTIFFCCSKKY